MEKWWLIDSASDYTKAVVPGANPASLTLVNCSEDRQSHRESTIERHCTVHSRLKPGQYPIFLSREKCRCRAEIYHFGNQLFNLQGFLSGVCGWGVSHCFKFNFYSQFFNCP